MPRTRRRDLFNPLRKVETNHLVFSSPRVSDALDGFTIAQLSDIHMGRWVKPGHMSQIISYVNDLAPDLVALTGDYVGYNKLDIDRCVASLTALQSPTYAVLGNHDHWTDGERARRAFAQTDILLLENDMILHQDLLEVVGVDDLVTRNADVDASFQHSEIERFALVLNHVPKLANACISAGGDLVLSGHTHNYQFNIPHLTDRLARALGEKYASGAYSIEHGYLYVNRGLGSASWPWRIRATPEISFFELRRGDRPHLEQVGSELFSVEQPPRRTLRERMKQARDRRAG